MGLLDSVFFLMVKRKGIISGTLGGEAWDVVYSFSIFNPINCISPQQCKLDLEPAGIILWVLFFLRWRRWSQEGDVAGDVFLVHFVKSNLERTAQLSTHSSAISHMHEQLGLQKTILIYKLIYLLEIHSNNPAYEYNLKLFRRKM